MLTYNELIELREKLSNDEVTIDFATELYWKNFEEGQKSWHTTDWKERRAKIIKEKCEICNSNKTLTLQHKSHPKKYGEYLRDITSKYTRDYINNNDLVSKQEFIEYILANYDYQPVPFCPKCKFGNPRKRVTKVPQYVCTVCKHEFDNAVYKSVKELVSIFYENEHAIEVRDKCFISKDGWGKQHLSNIRYWIQRSKTKDRNPKEIEKAAFLLYLEDNIKYLSFEDTITACKRCAFSYDINRMELCPKCKEHYKGIRYATCIQCLPEDKKKAALEMIEFGKEWRQMHKDLGID
ncbi:hypothetical protein D3C86_423150 [compost metagenome]